MALTKKKKFVIRHVFNDVLQLKQGISHDSEMVKHFNVDWHISTVLHSTKMGLYLDCPIITDNKKYSIKVDITLKLRKNTGEEKRFHSKDAVFSLFASCKKLVEFNYPDINKYLINGKLNVECHVKILEMTGIKEMTVPEKFYESSKEYSDVVLIIQDKKFHVMKQYLASHSAYFKSLFFGNFDESKQSEIDIKDIDPIDFQNYLELIHGESLVNDDSIDGILELADFFDSKIATRRCEDFLLKTFQKTLKEKFELANKYKLDNLMKKCLSEIKTPQDIRSILPEDLKTLDLELSNQLLLKSLSLGK